MSVPMHNYSETILFFRRLKDPMAPTANPLTVDEYMMLLYAEIDNRDKPFHPDLNKFGYLWPPVEVDYDEIVRRADLLRSPLSSHTVLDRGMAMVYRYRVTKKPEVDPRKDDSIPRAIDHEDEWVEAMMTAFYNVVGTSDNPFSFKVKGIRKFDEGGRPDPAFVGPHVVESACRALFYHTIDRCVNGFRGHIWEDRTLWAKIYPHVFAEDRLANCHQRMQLIVDSLRDWKVVCYDIVNSEAKAMVKLANAPRAYASEKDANKKNRSARVAVNQRDGDDTANLEQTDGRDHQGQAGNSEASNFMRRVKKRATTSSAQDSDAQAPSMSKSAPDAGHVPHDIGSGYGWENRGPPSPFARPVRTRNEPFQGQQTQNSELSGGDSGGHIFADSMQRDFAGSHLGNVNMGNNYFAMNPLASPSSPAIDPVSGAPHLGQHMHNGFSAYEGQTSGRSMYNNASDSYHAEAHPPPGMDLGQSQAGAMRQMSPMRLPGVLYGSPSAVRQGAYSPNVSEQHPGVGYGQTAGDIPRMTGALWAPHDAPLRDEASPTISDNVHIGMHPLPGSQSLVGAQHVAASDPGNKTTGSFGFHSDAMDGPFDKNSPGDEFAGFEPGDPDIY